MTSKTNKAKDKKTLPRWNILIAEDDLKQCRQLKKALPKNVRCTIVHNGKDALKIHEESIKAKRYFDFVLLDVSMPGMDGFEVLRLIRERENKKPAPKESVVIMVTAYRDSLMEKYNLGWDDFITKPIDGKKLVHHMETFVKKERPRTF